MVAAADGSEKGYLTLRRLVVWLGEARSRLRCLAVLADSVTGLPGAQLVAALAAHSLQGQPLSRATVCPPPARHRAKKGISKNLRG